MRHTGVGGRKDEVKRRTAGLPAQPGDEIPRKTKTPDGGDTYFENRIDYILKTASNWEGSIGKFHVVVDKGAPKNLVSFCGEDVKKIGETQFEMKKMDYTPDGNLAVLILKKLPPP